MKCPKCKKEIDRVWIISECHQQGLLEGNEVVEYIDLAVEGTLYIQCPECQEKITRYIEET